MHSHSRHYLVLDLIIRDLDRRQYRRWPQGRPFKPFKTFKSFKSFPNLFNVLNDWNVWNGLNDSPRSLAQGGAQAEALAQPARHESHGGDDHHSRAAKHRDLRITAGLE